jgi:hypothetical protein
MFCLVVGTRGCVHVDGWSTVLTLYPHCETPGPVYVFPGSEEQNTSMVILQCCVSLPCFACVV